MGQLVQIHLATRGVVLAGEHFIETLSSKCLVLISKCHTCNDNHVLWPGVSVYRRKWLPPSLRKLSQGKVEKTNTTVPTSSPPLIGPSLKKSGSDKRFKLPSGVEHNRPGKTAFEAEAQAREGEEVGKREEGEEIEQQELEVDVDADVTESDDTAVTSLQEQNGGEDADDDLELPPPMKPITEPILVATANGPSGSTIPSELPGKRVSIRALFLESTLEKSVREVHVRRCNRFILYSLPVCRNVRPRFSMAALQRPISRKSSRLSRKEW